MSFTKKLLGILTLTIVGGAAPAALASPPPADAQFVQVRYDRGGRLDQTPGFYQGRRAFEARQHEKLRRAAQMEQEGLQQIARGKELTRLGRMTHRPILLRQGKQLERQGKALVRQAAALEREARIALR